MGHVEKKAKCGTKSEPAYNPDDWDDSTTAEVIPELRGGVEMRVFPTLETERLQLAPIGEERLADMYEIYSDPKIMFFYGKNPHRNPRETLATIKALECKFQDGLSIEWGMVQKETGKLIGTIAECVNENETPFVAIYWTATIV